MRGPTPQAISKLWTSLLGRKTLNVIIDGGVLAEVDEKLSAAESNISGPRSSAGQMG